MRQRIIDRLAELSRPTGEEDLLDVAFPRPRLQVTLRQGVLALAATGVLLLGWLMFRAPDPASAPVIAVAASTSTGETPLRDPVAETMVVSVVGAVERPGLHELPADSRAADALTVAGVLPGADTRNINLAARLVDGMQLTVPLPGESPLASGPGAADTPVSLNSATAEQLESLPGIGAATSAAIITHRAEHGGFSAVGDLVAVPGIGPAKLARLEGLVTL
ncbi:helix-hairpin-helix domain-containing protein [Corynebacterium pygosceleis]|uniref:ComEA family DNA-binding protein n=1 Tax=Corynebacterium pygosceleis TaxID=2800406 RepID=A0A9Q4GJB4_9CORY|nr:ComEA family DNA-binding protein [Corynebacterium pygosceleis]MCK7636438.1 ComEA family DNA-binding protein [Corynebacterium pygosceleis]MCK7675011.1 ComEA family DNA-binding protein [Corynebacterium pygosceleis]MCL0121422.1 ComEA family DNA-binding protein [Corynebacterium pygosceleis]MCX7469248.1 ComEA family DNA-binding protein [Corynebacterium pygosceleis]